MKKNMFRMTFVFAAFVSSMSFIYMHATDANAQSEDAIPETPFNSCNAACYQSGSTYIVGMAANYPGGYVVPTLATLQSPPSTQACFNIVSTAGCAFRHVVGSTIYKCRSIYTSPLQSQFSQSLAC